MGHILFLYIMVDLFNYTRRASSVAHIGALGLGGDNPIRIQSMTTTNTNDTEALPGETGGRRTDKNSQQSICNNKPSS